MGNYDTEKLNSKYKVKKPCDRQNNITIYVYSNGKYRESPKKIVLSKDDRSFQLGKYSFIYCTYYGHALQEYKIVKYHTSSLYYA